MSSVSTPLVSVLTPVYNTEQYLAECIESVLAQTYTNWEYIIVDNCSSDRTPEIAEAYARKDARIRVHHNVEFLDIIANHNHAFRLMPPEATYCKVVSADDWIYPDCIRQMVDLAEANPSVGIVNVYSINTERVNHVGVPYPDTMFPGREICRRALLGGPYMLGAPTSLMYRGDLLRSVHDFFPNSSPHADTAACYEYLDRWDFGFVHQILAFERLHGGQTSEKSRVMNRYIAEVLRNLVTYGPRYLTREELEARIHEHLGIYRKFLGKSFLKGRDQEFWDYHRQQLAEAGYPLTSATMVRAVAGYVLDLVLNPKDTIERLLASRVKKPDVASSASGAKPRQRATKSVAVNLVKP